MLPCILQSTWTDGAPAPANLNFGFFGTGAQGGAASRQGVDATAARRSLQIDSFVAANLPPPAAARPLEENINFFKPKGGARGAESNGGTNAAQSKVCIPAAILLMSNLKVETN